MLTLQSDVKVIITGTTIDPELNNGIPTITSARFNSNGSLDTSFGNNGTVLTLFGSTCFAKASFIQPDGKIILAGLSLDDATSFSTVRYQTTGAIDTTYGTAGTSSSPLYSYNQVNSVLMQQDGKFLVTLSKYNDFENTDFNVRRFNPDGTFDEDFGGENGITTSFYNSYDEAFAMILQPDNKIVVGGTTDTGINRDFALARYENVVVLETEDFEENIGLILYPNPVNNIVNLAGSNSHDVIEYSIFDMLGKVIYTGKDLQVDTTNFIRGIYTIRINTNKGIVNKKFMKE